MGTLLKKILIVEDNPLNMKLFNDLLQVHGFITLCSPTGLDAIKIAQEHQPDLIILDIHLPEVSGAELVKQFRQDKKLAHVPVIAVTAYAMRGDEERILEAGCDQYLSKPISVGQFLAAVKKFLV